MDQIAMEMYQKHGLNLKCIQNVCERSGTMDGDSNNANNFI